MLNQIKKQLVEVFIKSQFCFEGIYSLIALFTNPFYLIRKNLYNNIKSMSGNLSGRLLDFGCGSKPYADMFKNCCEYVGCDIETSGHEHTNENIDVYYDGKHLPFQGGHSTAYFPAKSLSTYSI